MTWNCWLFKKYTKAKCCKCGKTLWLSKPPNYSPICEATLNAHRSGSQ